MSADREPVVKGLQILGTKGLGHVISEIRSVTLLQEKDFYPYNVSSITLEKVSLADLYPCALYVLKSGLETAKELRDEMLLQGIDTLNLTEDNTQIIFNWKGQEDCVIFPPMVEVSEDDGDILVATDGLHRAFLARQLEMSHISAIVIKNTACPLPALPVTWGEVMVCDTVPPSDEKRRYRFQSTEELNLWPLRSRRNRDRFLQGFENKREVMKELEIRLAEFHSRKKLTF